MALPSAGQLAQVLSTVSPRGPVFPGAAHLDSPSPSKEARHQSHFIYLLWVSMSPSQPLGGAHGFNPCVRRGKGGASEITK